MAVNTVMFNMVMLQQRVEVTVDFAGLVLSYPN